MANSHFQETVVPSVCQASSVEEKYSLLVDGIYSYMATTYGTRKYPNRKWKRGSPAKHERALRKVTELRNKAREDFRRAKREGRLQEDIQSFARNFFDLVRQHSKVKRRAEKLRGLDSAKKARQ